MPKGGKYSANPILVEDQREAQQRATRLGRTRTNALGKLLFFLLSKLFP